MGRQPPATLSLLLAFAAIYFLWGSTYLGIHFALQSLSPLLMAGARYLVAGGILYTFAYWRGAARPTRRGWGVALLSGAGILAVGNGGVTLGQQYLPSGLTALLLAVIPLLVVVLGWFGGLTPRPTARVACGLALGVGGIFLVTRIPAASRVVQPGHPALGIGCVLLAALGSALGALYTSRHRAAASPWLASGMQMLCGGTLLLLSSGVRGELSGFRLASITPASGLAFAYLVVFGSLLAFTAYGWLLQVVNPALASTYAFVNPLVAMVLGWAVLGEQLSPRLLSSAALIVGAVGLVIWDKLRARG